MSKTSLTTAYSPALEAAGMEDDVCSPLYTWYDPFIK